MRARLNPRIDMGDALSGRPLRVQIGIENAASTAPLQLQPGSFPDLQGGLAEQLDQLGRGRTDQIAVNDIGSALHPWRSGALLRGRRSGTAGEKQQGGQGEDATHGPSMAVPPARRKLAAAPRHR